MTQSLALGAWSDLALHAKPIRQQVFVRELAMPEALAEDEFDRSAHHAVLFDCAKAIGTARLLSDGSIGRVAIIVNARRRGYGGLLLNALTELAVERGFAQVKLSALAKTLDFYERHDFRTLGMPRKESGQLQQAMVKPLASYAPWVDTMPEELSTPDLLLRPGRYADAPAIRAAMQSWDVVRFLALPPWPYLHGHALGWMNTYVDQWQRNKTAPFVIVEKASDTLVGTAGLRAGALADARPALGNVGYWIARPHWGKGYATQALKALLAYGFDILGMNRIDACHLAENRASGRVMLRAGMQQEGIRRGYSKGRDGQWHDDVLYSMLSTDPR